MNIVPVRVRQGCYLMVSFGQQPGHPRNEIIVEARTGPTKAGGYASFPVRYSTYKQALLACAIARGDSEWVLEGVVCGSKAEFDARLASYKLALK
jgi:hypothetical protein